jgi:hypothetical protein
METLSDVEVIRREMVLREIRESLDMIRTGPKQYQRIAARDKIWKVVCDELHRYL